MSATPVARAVHRAERARTRSGALAAYRCGGLPAASVRSLPPPFSTWCTIASDADSPRIEKFEQVGLVLRETLALPIADSFIPHWFYNRGFVEDEGAGGNGHELWRLSPDVMQFLNDRPLGRHFDYDAFLAANGRWLRRFHQGWTDMLHGWLLRTCVRVGRSVHLRGVPGAGGWIARLESRPRLARLVPHAYRASRTARRRASLELAGAPGWHTRVPPRYLCFRYRNPVVGTRAALVFRLGESELARVDITDIPGGAPETLQEYVLDLYPVVGADAEVLKGLQVELEVQGVSSDVTIESPALVSWLREDLEDQAAVMTTFNLRTCAYTSHGGGFNIGHYKVQDARSADVRMHAELPAAPHYAADLLDGLGVEFLNSASNTSGTSLVHIRELVFPRIVNDGRVIYDFHRFMQPGDPGVNLSLEPSLHMHIGAVIRESTEPGAGAVIYTHFMSRPPGGSGAAGNEAAGGSASAGREAVFSEESLRALQGLARRYYGLAASGGREGSGAPPLPDGPVRTEEGEHAGGAGTPPSGRVFVAPASAMLRYSQALRHLEGHAFYDEEQDTVHVFRDTDPVTGRLFPEQGSARQLRYATFYVRRAATARLLVDGEPCPDLVRNGPDETGRESITVADTLTTTPLCGRVHLGAGGRELARCSGLALEPATPPASPDAPPLGNRLRLEAPRGELVIRTPGCSLANHAHLVLRLGGELSGLDWGLRLERGGAPPLELASGGRGGRAGALRADPAPESPWTWIVPFHAWLSGRAAGLEELPVQALERVRLELRGAPGTELELLELSLARDDDRPVDGTFLLGGEVGPDTGVERVRATGPGVRLEARPGPEGLFLFREKLPRGSLLRVEGLTAGGECRIPAGGPWVEVTRDSLELRFGQGAGA